MNDTDYIYKAVELADGFYIDITGCYRTPRHSIVEVQVYNDALAAQLVRQVDAMPSMRVWSGIKTVSVYYSSIREGKASGPDRTMNTIKAIVDSKILEDRE